MAHAHIFILAALLISLSIPSPANAASDPEPTDEIRRTAALFTPREAGAASSALWKQAENTPDTQPGSKGDLYARSVMLMKIAAERGDAPSQLQLGTLYEEGRVIRKDSALAFKWLKKAADQGMSTAQYGVAAKYEFGVGVRQDYSEAAKWYLAAANQHFAAAQMQLGLLYLNGQGVPKDIIIGHCWLNLSAANGEARALDERNRAAKLLTSAQVAEAQIMVREWIKQHPGRCVDEGLCLPMAFKP